MSTLVTTADVDAADRFDFIRELTATMWVPMECGGWCPPDYRGEFRASGLGPLQVVVLDIMPITVRRTTELIAQADPDMLKLFLVCAGGSSVVDQDGRQARLSAGEFTFYDTRRPYEVHCGTGDEPTRLMTFMFPPALLPLSPSARRRLTAVPIPATAGIGDLTSQFLLRLARNIEHCTPAEAARVSTAALEVLATRLARELDAGSWGTAEDRRHALLVTVQGFVQQHLGDPRLTPAGIAAQHHMSLRSLHQLFHDEGLTVAGWIRARRLERCRRDLADPSLDARPVAAVAARWGFTSAADFSKVFRSAHGVPPAEYRRFARVANTSAS
ncbi:helix-turn-helix domain-containing protein [Actinoplanes sp. TBRC 11911]|uniref:helix-turn-helix domain-containing protein n=1 Tax=Actinoplanes sp. TBRC 11911 TaxID=2729386 RepID=UPI00145CD033|nr:helix-turn-helix domain-containing protein [Actinoplanes sp. TBRC 11911]NMO57412.1 helix-turn-helix domain-containing protein [Actinoplanes sp. TBRC 11911]